MLIEMFFVTYVTHGAILAQASKGQRSRSLGPVGRLKLTHKMAHYAEATKVVESSNLEYKFAIEHVDAAAVLGQKGKGHVTRSQNIGTQFTITSGNPRHGLPKCRLTPDLETYWSRIRRNCAQVLHFDRILMVSAVKICKQCLQTASASGTPRPQALWAIAPQMKILGSATD